MYAFFVLGLVPGTNIQINFKGWLAMFSLVMGIITLLIINGRRRALQAALDSTRVVTLPSTELRHQAQ